MQKVSFLDDPPGWFADRPVGTGWLVFGLFALLRGSSNKIAWPKEYSFMGTREASPYGILERSLNDIAFIGMAIGAGMVLIAFAMRQRRPLPSSPTTYQQ